MRKARETGSTYDRECGVSESRGWAWATYRVAGAEGFRATVWERAPLGVGPMTPRLWRCDPERLAALRPVEAQAWRGLADAWALRHCADPVTRLYARELLAECVRVLRVARWRRLRPPCGSCGGVQTPDGYCLTCRCRALPADVIARAS